MIVAAVPFKQLSAAKTRLAGQLPRGEREQLALWLLNRTVVALRQSGVLDRLVLVSPAEDLAGKLGVDVVPSFGDLNSDLGRAVAWASDLNAEGLLIVPADLPRITAAAVRAAVEGRGLRPEVAVARTQDGGTGLLMLSPPDVVPPSFGPDSFARHLALAKSGRAGLRVVDDGAFGFDLDTPEDLDTLIAGEGYRTNLSV